MYPLLLLDSFSSFSCYFSAYPFIYFACCSCLVVMDMPEGPKTVADPTMSTAPVSAVLAALTPIGLGNFLTFVLSSTKSSSLHSSLSFFYSLRAYAVPRVLFQVRLLLRWLQPLGLRLVAVLPPFLTCEWGRYLLYPIQSCWDQWPRPFELMGCWISLCWFSWLSGTWGVYHLFGDGL